MFDSYNKMWKPTTHKGQRKRLIMSANILRHYVTGVISFHQPNNPKKWVFSFTCYRWGNKHRSLTPLCMLISPDRQQGYSFTGLPILERVLSPPASKAQCLWLVPSRASQPMWGQTHKQWIPPQGRMAGVQHQRPNQHDSEVFKEVAIDSNLREWEGFLQRNSTCTNLWEISKSG